MDRFQMTFSSLDDFVYKDSPVRIIDAFIDRLDLDLLGFSGKPPRPEECKPQKVTDPLDGRPSFYLNIFLKLYFYGLQRHPKQQEARMGMWPKY
jgi:hypothetical protein